MTFTPEEKTVLKERIRLSETCLVDFRYYLLTNGKDEVHPPAYHYEWSDILLREKDNFAVEAFREAGKGQIVLRSYPLHSLMFPSVNNDYIVLIKQNATLASQKLLELETEYLTNPVLCANLVKVQQKSASIFSVDVKDAEGNIHNIRIEAYGKGSSIRGLSNVDRRPRIVILDDPQDTEDARSDTVLEADWNWFLGDVMFLGQKTRIFLIGNNLGEKCIIERVFNSAKELGFQIRKIAILDDNGSSNWPEKFPLSGINKQKESFSSLGQIDVWMRERMCVATSEETRVFNLKDFPRYSYLYVENIIRGHNIFITVDPASSTKNTSDYRAICVNAVSEQNIWTIIDFPYGRWKSDEFIDQLFNTVIKWTPYLSGSRRLPVGIEKGHFKQVLEPFIYKEMQRRNVYFDIREIEHVSIGSKLERVKMLSPLVKAHSIQLPEQSIWLSELECELTGVTKDGFKSLNDDLIDALAMQQQIAQSPVAGRQNRSAIIEEVPASAYHPLSSKYDKEYSGVL